jgi:hypothetical protein
MRLFGSDVNTKALRNWKWRWKNSGGRAMECQGTTLEFAEKIS